MLSDAHLSLYSYHSTQTASFTRLLGPLHLTLSILLPPPRSPTPSRCCLSLVLFCFVSLPCSHTCIDHLLFVVSGLMDRRMSNVQQRHISMYVLWRKVKGEELYGMQVTHPLLFFYTPLPIQTYMSILTASHPSLQCLCRSSPKNQKIAPRS